MAKNTISHAMPYDFTKYEDVCIKKLIGVGAQPANTQEAELPQAYLAVEDRFEELLGKCAPQQRESTPREEWPNKPGEGAPIREWVKWGEWIDSEPFTQEMLMYVIDQIRRTV